MIKPTQEWKYAAVLFLLTAAVYWKLVFTGQYTWLDSPDLARQVLPWFQFEMYEFRHFRLPLWDPFQHGGQPLLAQAQPGMAYPLNWALFLLPPGEGGWLRHSFLNWYFVALHFMALWFAYLLARDLGYGRAASTAAGALYSLGGFVGNIDWPQMLNGVVWAPLVFRGILRVWRGERALANASLAGLFLGVAALSGHHQAPTFTAMAAALLWGWLVYRNRGLWRAAVLFAVTAGLVSSLQMLPALEYSRLAYRWVSSSAPVTHTDAVPYSVHSFYSLSADSLLGLIFAGYYRHVSPYVGSVGLILIYIGLRDGGWRLPLIRLGCVGAIFGTLLALGSETPLHAIAYVLFPLADKARSPAMSVFLVHLSLIPILARGLDQVAVAAEDAWPALRRFVPGAALAIFAVLFLVIVAKPGEFQGDSRPARAVLFALLALALLNAIRVQALSAAAGRVLLVALVFADLYGHATWAFPNRYETHRNGEVLRLASNHELAAALRSLDTEMRTELNNENIPYNFGDWYGLEVWHGYLASLTRLPYDLAPWERRVRELFSVAYLVGKQPSDAWNEEVRATNDDGLKIYRNKDALARVRVVHEAEQIADFATAKKAIAQGPLDLRARVVLPDAAPELDKCGGSEPVRLLERKPGTIAIWADLRCRGMVLLSDTYYPGWQATVDGKPAAIHRAYWSMRGVVAERGSHLIEFRYRPMSVYFGALLTLAGVLLCAFTWRAGSREANQSS